MQGRIGRARFSRAAAAAIGCLLVLSCGSTTPTTSTGLTTVFTPDSPSPPDGSMTLQPGSSTGTLFQVKVSAKGISDLFGAAFWISYDTASVQYQAYDVTTSLVCDGGCDTDAKLDAVTVVVDAVSLAGTVKVAVSRRQLPDGTVRGVNVTDAQDLIVLSFTARATVTGSPIQFVDGHGAVVNSTAPPTNTIAVTWAGGSVSVH